MRILVYGDSNVWGDNFFTGKRIPDEKQWVNILKSLLNKEDIIYQAGLPGRVAGDFLVEKSYKNGKSVFLSTLKTVSPVDIIIIALGTNDLQALYKRTETQIIDDLLWYKNIILQELQDEETKSKYYDNKIPRIIYVLPPNFDYKSRASEIFDKNSENVRNKVNEYFVSNIQYCIRCDDLELFEDGIHYNYNDHTKVAGLVLGVVKDVNKA